MAKPVARIAALQLAIGAGLVLVVVRAGWLQLLQGRKFARQAASIRTAERELDARRGTIYDRNGTPLVLSQPKYRVLLALNEVQDTPGVIRRVASDLHIPADSLRRSFRRGTPRYPYFQGPFTAPQVSALRRMRGVHFETVYGRSYPIGVLAGALIGALAPDGRRGSSGLERTLDPILAGRPGRTTFLKDPSGRLFESPGRLVSEPVPGNDVILTLDAELQGIAEYSLAKAIKAFKAEGGDVVFLDPRTGEILAAASLASGDATPLASAFTTPFEPGSTAKPFTAAVLLTLGRVDSTETVWGERGRWIYETSPGHTRKIEDTHPDSGHFTLARAIQKSSNIAMAKFSLKLHPEEHYEMLRGFGFGAPTGVEFPSEANGSLRRPHGWRYGYDSQSMATGYGFAVTPIQLAAAYGALANDGLLLAPTLVKEIRSPDGERLYRHEPEVIRRVISAEVAAKIRGFLAEAASDSGTGGRAQVRGGILGKTGTAQIVENGRYAPGEYRASFAGIYPAKNPQLVVVVTIDRPRGEYYGGLTAAPVTADMLRQALAARGSALDRAGPGRDVAVVRRRQPDEPEDVASPAASVRLPLAPAAQRPAGSVLIPDVLGRPIRAAAFALHQRGLRVRIAGAGTGRVVRSVPGAGDSLPAGRTVVLYAESGGRVP